MNIEKYVTHYVENAVKIVQTEISSVRKKDIEKTSVRLYDGVNMGVAGALGKCDEEVLYERAEKSLKLNIPYPYSPAAANEREEHFESDLQDELVLLEETADILERLREQQPKFSFSHIFKSSKLESMIENDLGLKLKSCRESVSLALVVKDKSSSNIIDAVTGYEGRRFNKKGFLDLTSMICDAFSNQIDEFTDGTYPVVFSSDDGTYLKKMYESLHGMLFGSGSSLLSGKIGQKVFSPDFTLYQTRRAADGFSGAFFDYEGTFNSDERFALIEDGVLIAPYTDKKTASTFKLPLTGAAGGEYDGLPELGFPLLKIKESERTAKQLLNDRMGIFILIASGGDFTPDGHFASPVQLAFLFDGERFLGRLPELSVSSSLQEMFGRDFAGVSRDDMFELENTKVTVMNMSVERLR